MKKKIVGVFVLLLGLICIPKVFAEETKTVADFILNEKGQLVVNSIPPKDYDEAIALIGDYTFYNKDASPKYDAEKYGEGSIEMDTCNENYTKCKLVVREYMSPDIIFEKEVEIVYNYDENIKKQLEELIKNFPKDIENFEVSDLELINYWMNIKDELDDHLDNYSGQLKSYLNHANIDFYVDNRAGDDSSFYNIRKGIATLSYDGIIYYVDTFLGTKATNIIAVPDDTTDVLVAAQKRIDEYLGAKDLVKIELGGKIADWIEDYKKEIEESSKEYYNNTYNMYKSSYDSCKSVNGEESTVCESIIPDQYKTFEAYQTFINFSFDDYEVFDMLESSGETSYYTAEINGIKHNFLIKKDSSLMKKPYLNTSDLNTNVSITTESANIPLDTSIKSKKITEGTDYDKIMETLNVTESDTYDLTLYSNTLGEFIKKLDNGSFAVKLPIEKKFEGKDLIVYYVTTDNKIEEHEVTVKDGFASFTTNHFSIYTLAEKKVEVPTEEPKVEEPQKEEQSISPKTGDTFSIYLLLIILGITGLVTLRITCKK